MAAVVPPRPVSDTTAVPFGATFTANAPGPALGFTVIAESVPFEATPNTSTSLFAFSVVNRKRPLALNATEPGFAR